MLSLAHLTKEWKPRTSVLPKRTILAWLIVVRDSSRILLLVPLPKWSTLRSGQSTVIPVVRFNTQLPKSNSLSRLIR
jgi:hypothetical protein